MTQFLRKRIPVSELQLGMYVCGLDCSWFDSPFLRHRFHIRDRKQITALRGACRHVTIDLRRGADVPPLSAVSLEEPVSTLPSTAIEPATSEESLALEAEMRAAAAVHQRASGVVERLLEDVRLGRSLNLEGPREVVRELAASVLREPNALLCLSQLKSRGRYTIRHSVNASIFILTFARHLALPREVMNELGLGALLHDIGKLRVPDEILNKPGKLTKTELELARRHPHYGKQLLDGKSVGAVAVDLVYNHHERLDGSGYPRGLKGRELSLYARMLAIVDVYDAITSQRVYGDPIPTQDAMRLLYQLRSKSFDARLVEQFIQCLGVYPAGSLVEMDSGEVGVVVKVNEADRTRPVVKLLLDGAKRPLDDPPMVDLTRPFGDRAPITIEKVIAPLEWKGSLGSLWSEVPGSA